MALSMMVELDSCSDTDDQSDPACMLDGDNTPHYDTGDLVWAKVKSHPWWPGQVFNSAFASEEAKSMERPGRILVAFYGDHTFSWLEHSQILAFKDYFNSKVKATTAKRFKNAVLEALDDVCWRAESHLLCKCRSSIRENGSIPKQWARAPALRFKDLTKSKGTFNARKCLSFLKDVARAPRTDFSSMFEANVLHGHALGLRTGLFANKGDDTIWGFNCEPSTVRCSGDMMEFRADASDSDASNDTFMKQQSRSECRKRLNDESAFFLEDWRAKRLHVFEKPGEGIPAKESSNSFGSCGMNTKNGLASQGDPIRAALHGENHAYEEFGCVNELTKKLNGVLPEVSRERVSFNKTKLELKQQNQGVAPCNLASFCDEKSNNLFMQISEELRFLAVDPLCSYDSSNEMTRVANAVLSHRNLVFHKSSGYNSHRRSSGLQEEKMKHAHGTSEHAKGASKRSKTSLVGKAIRYCRPMNKKCSPHVSEEVNICNNAATISSQRRQTMTPDACAQCVAGGTHRDKISDKGSDKMDAFAGLSSDKGVSPVYAGSQTNPELDVHELLLEAQKKKSDLIRRPSLGKGEAGEYDQARRDVNSEVSFVSKVVKQSQERKLHGVVINEAFADAPKTVAYERYVPSNGHGDDSRPSSGIGVYSAEQGSAMETSEDTGICHVSDIGPCSTGLPEMPIGHWEDTRVVESTSKTGVCSVSYLPVGIYIKFPSSFPLPSEVQLNAIFTQFGALGSAGIKVFRETASAQVIFEHAKEAENACKCVKEVSPFGNASVIFRLQYFAFP